MEEVWNGIALSNLPPNHPSPPLSVRHTAAAAFHDFLSGTFKDSHPPQSPDTLPSYTLSLRSGNQPEPFLPRKRCTIDHQPASTITDGGEERRWKKMIKNRESAARSRARKQASLKPLSSAYTNELEMEVAQLVQENAALKRERGELKMAIAAQATSKGKLQRASSSPF